MSLNYFTVGDLPQGCIHLRKRSTQKDLLFSEKYLVIIFLYNYEQNFRMETLGAMNTPEIQLLNAIEATNLDKFKDYWLPPDAVVLACAIDPSVSKNINAVNSSILLHVLYMRIYF